MISRVAGHILGLVFPGSCNSCGRPLHGGRYFCAGCLGKIRYIGDYVCSVCGMSFSGAGVSHPCHHCMRKKPPFEMARATAVYEGVLREAVHLYKYRPVRGLRLYLGGLAAEGAMKWFPAATVAAPVPLHKARFRERGFNQSLFLAKSAADALGIRLSVDGLARVRYTVPQVELGPAERAANVKGAFEAGPYEFRGESVLLVDDVFTTGATVSECARVLKKAGAMEVFVLTVARVVRD